MPFNMRNKFIQSFIKNEFFIIHNFAVSRYLNVKIITKRRRRRIRKQITNENLFQFNLIKKHKKWNFLIFTSFMIILRRVAMFVSCCVVDDFAKII